MIDWEAQGVYAARSRAIYFLRRWEQGQPPINNYYGVCGNLNTAMRYDLGSGRRLKHDRRLPASMMLAYPYQRKEGYKAGHTLADDIYDLIDTLAADWPETYGDPHYPIDGLAGYNIDREFDTLWSGLGGAKRRRLCGWIADQLEREEV